MGAFQKFVSWHRDDDRVWRDIYTRTVSALIAAFVIGLVGAASGALPWRPFRLAIGILFLAAQALWIAWTRALFRSPRWRLRLLFTYPMALWVITTGDAMWNWYRNGRYAWSDQTFPSVLYFAAVVTASLGSTRLIASRMASNRRTSGSQNVRAATNANDQASAEPTE